MQVVVLLLEKHIGEREQRQGHPEVNPMPSDKDVLYTAIKENASENGMVSWRS